MSFSEPFLPRIAFYVRLAIGLVFGLGMAWLTPDKGDVKDWHQVGFYVLGLGAFVLWSATATLSRLSWVGWGAIALGIIGYISHHAVFTQTDTTMGAGNNFWLILPFLFIINELVIAADVARKPIAPYETYFEQAWKRGVQLALSLVFTGLFWAILLLGAWLLKIIGFSWLGDLLEKDYISMPLTGMAIATAVHLGDVQPKLLNSVRALVLGVLSWLLPVITLMGLIFAVSLAFSGLAPLWKTKAATASLLATCVGLVLLINAAYQQGNEDRSVPVFMRWSARIACVLVLFFAVLAAYSLSIRIAQYGLTPERIMALVGVIVACAYGLAYGFSALWPKGRWLAKLEPANVGLAYFKVAVFFALLTPIADPRKIAVDDQISRLTSGKTKAEKFDWALLRYETGVYGINGLKSLIKHPQWGAKALEVQKWSDENRWDHRIESETKVALKKPDAKRFIKIATETKTLPESFVMQGFDSQDHESNFCLLVDNAAKSQCFWTLKDINHDNQDELLIYSDNGLAILSSDQKHWQKLTHYYLSPEQIADFKVGKFTIERPALDNIVYDSDKAKDGD